MGHAFNLFSRFLPFCSSPMGPSLFLATDGPTIHLTCTSFIFSLDASFAREDWLEVKLGSLPNADVTCSL